MNVETALLTGLLAGLFGSTHCLGMCGGIVGLLHAQIPAGRGALAIGFHIGRISSYLAIGLLATGIGMLPAAAVPDAAPQLMRWLLGAVIVLMAVYIALPGHIRDLAGQFAAPLTRRMMPVFAKFLPVRSLDNAIGLGLLWGMLPCGLLYTVIATAVLLADPVATTGMILAFGIGTVPLLLGGGLLMLRFRSAVSRPGLRWLAAALLATTGVLVAAGPWLADAIEHPWMQFLVECVSD